MAWKTHSEQMKEQMANPEYAQVYAEMKAELEREFQRAEEHKNQQFKAGTSAEPPAETRAGRNGTARDALSGKAGRASNRMHRAGADSKETVPR